MVLVYEGVHEKFSAQLKIKKETNSTILPAKTPENKYEPYFVNKWTNNEGGNRKFGGWRDAAFDRLAELRKIIKNARKGDEAKVVIKHREKAALTCMRVRMGLEAPTREAEKRNNRAKKRKRDGAKPKSKAAKDKMLMEWNSDADSDAENEAV